MKNIRFNRFFQIVYPLLVYYLLYNLSYGLFVFIFKDSVSGLFCLMLAGLLTLIPEYFIYKGSFKLIPDQEVDYKYIFTCVLYVILVVAVGIGLNIILTQSGLIDISKNYNRANDLLTTGDFLVKIGCNVIVIPILEELLYRAIICGQLTYFTNNTLAVIISSLCFGILHFNLIQFIYAFLVGLILSYTYVKTKRLSVVILAHGLTNLLVILFA